MKILVAVKRVIDYNVQIRVKEDGTGVVTENVKMSTNPPDDNAIEEAVKIKESGKATEVIAVTIGEEKAQETVRKALAVGADRGIHIENPESKNIDPLKVAKNICKSIEQENFDLILSGLQSDDTGMGQTGVLVGELLNMSTATLAIKTDIDQEKIKVKRELESGWFQWVTLESPASVSIQSGINQPRYPSLKGIMGAKKKEIKIIDASIEDSKQKLDKIFVPQKSKETEVIDTDVDASVDRIVDILRSEIKAF